MQMTWGMMILTLAMLAVSASPAFGVKPTSTEINRAKKWTVERFGDSSNLPTAEVPFSFQYGDRSSSDFLTTWKVSQSSLAIDKKRVEHVVTYTDPETKLVVTCRAVRYTDFPTVEWTLYFKNLGKNDTPIISEIRPLNLNFTHIKNDDFTLHYNTGDTCSPTSYAPQVLDLNPGVKQDFANANGRPTNDQFPYWNLANPNGGMIAVLSWNGQWSAQFSRNAAGDIQINAGQELTHFTLHAGESVRSPLALVQFYDGDWVRGQNIWRKWMFACNFPKLDGKPLRPLAHACNGNHYPGIITNAAEELHFMKRYVEEGIKPDFWWEDAGWYKCGDPPAWWNTGTWEVDPARWPKGIREVSDWCKVQGIRTIVWFEPERCVPGMWIPENHPEWVYKGKEGGLVNIGNPECRQFLTDRVNQIMKDEGIHFYRQDFNIGPLSYWRENDTPDRQGISEIRHIEGLFRFWDDIKKNNNDCLIDSCASGGNRNDLETLRRAVPLLRSDNIFDPLAEQCHTYGISMWIPFNGTGFMTFDKYLIRSVMGPSFTMGADMRLKDADYKMFLQAYKDWKRISPCFFGDYYPLTPHSLEKNVWIGWQFDLSDKGQGVVQVYRREEAVEESIVLKINGLDANASYELENMDSKKKETVLGRDLMTKGYTIKIAEKPGSTIVVYKKVRE